MLDVHSASTQLADWSAQIPIISAVAIFGSYAKGHARSESDLDIAIVLDLPDFHDRLAEYMFSKQQWSAEIQKLLAFEAVSLHRLDEDCIGKLGRYLLDGYVVVHDPHGRLRRYIPALRP
jgi:predicted nucleotidyltransferase